jgi:choline dehydrogenase-like flavoprotein
VLSAEGPLAGAALADWPVSYAELARHYDRAEREFGVSGAAGANPFSPPRSGPYPNPPHPPRRSGLIFERGAQAAGLHPFPGPIAINPVPFDGRAGCSWGGACQGFGCDPRQATSLSPHPRAPDGRASRAPRHFSCPGRDGRARRAPSRRAGPGQEVRARHVVVAGGAMGSPHLLLLSRSGRFPDGLANSSGLVGRNLTFHHHAAARLVMDEPALGVTGIEAYRALDDWHASDPERGFIRGGVVAEINSFTRQPIGYALTGAGDPGLTRSWGAAQRYLREFPRDHDRQHPRRPADGGEPRRSRSRREGRAGPSDRAHHAPPAPERHRHERLVRAEDRGARAGLQACEELARDAAGVDPNRHEDGNARQRARAAPAGWDRMPRSRC